MPVLRTIFRVSIPAGVVYWTYGQGLWSPAVGSAESLKQFEKQDAQVKTWTKQAVQYVNPYIQPYINQVQDSVKIPDFKRWYNCGVRLTFRSIADFDPSLQSKRFVNWVVTQTTAPPATPDKTESKEPKKE